MPSHSIFKTKARLVAALFFLSIVSSCQSENKQKGEENTNEEEFSQKDLRTLSETTGYLLVENLKASKLDLDYDALILGIQEAEAGSSPPLDKEQYMKLMNRYRAYVLRKQSAENLATAEVFLEANKNKPGVVTLHNGQVEYKILKKGAGKEVTENSVPLIKYKGSFIDGTVFDSEQEGPVPLPLKATIPGFRIGIVGMKEGEIRRIYIHPSLGYGTSGPLPPNSLLVFDVEVVKADTDNHHEEPETKTGQKEKTEDHANTLKNEKK